MPKIKVGWDERYPDFYISDSIGDPEIEITDEELEVIRLGEEAYDRAQAILARAKRKR